MAHALAQVRLRRNSGLPEDTIINTFHFQSFDPAADFTLEDYATIGTRLKEFYRDPVSGSSTVLFGIFSDLLAQGPHETRIYRMNDPKPRAPRYTEEWSWSAQPSGASHPAEVAVCLSFRAPLTSGVPAARRKGRVFLGPLDVNAVESNSGDARPSAAMRTAIASYAKRLMDYKTGPIWSTYSEVGNSLGTVVQAWVDDSFDTQRRRGAKPNTRTVVNQAP